MQNDYLDRKNGKNYVEASEEIVEGIIDKIREAEEKEEYIYYTLDIPIEKYRFKNQELASNDKESIKIQLDQLEKETKWGCELYEEIKDYLVNHQKVMKSYYAMPPETLLRFQKKFKKESHIIEKIEFVGVETHICVLANAICLQSAFPQARIIIHGNLCRSKDQDDHKYGLKIMDALGMEIRS